MSAHRRPLVLAILDGWGYRPEQQNNAIAQARKPVFDKLSAEFPSTLLHASDHFVGLPDGQMGNSEVGHLNIGAGRVVEMDITRIDGLVASGKLAEQPAVKLAFEHARLGDMRALHLLGLVSDGGVHSHQKHLYALLRAAREAGVHRVFVHAFLDGRDTLPTSGAGYLEQLLQIMREVGIGKLASVSGRYYAMDRDMRWERVKKSFDAMVGGLAEGGAYSDSVARVRECYSNGVTDEFIVPFVVTDEEGLPIGTVRADDACIMFNYRADRARQITRVLARNSGLAADAAELQQIAEQDAAIARSLVPENLVYVTMTQYDKKYTLPRVIEPQSMENLLANLLAQANLRNLRIAETEKYAHVTYFFNGGIETPFAGEDRILIPSKKVATYDLAPEMSAEGVADAVVKAVEDTAFELVVVNFANADMVAHSGQLEPTIRGVEAVDAGLGRIYAALRQRGGSMLITADHGNAELMVDPIGGGPHTSHTTNPVPCILLSEDAHQYRLREGGSLRDLSPTILAMLGLQQPREMSGADLRQRLG